MPDPISLKSAADLLLRGIRDYAIITLDPTGLILSWNEVAQRITGFASQDVLGRPCAVLQTAENIAAGKSEKMLQGAREHGRVEDEGWRPRKDGSRFWACAVLTTVRDDRGQII